MHGEFLLIPLFYILYEILKGEVSISLIECQLFTVDNKTFTFLNLSIVVVMENEFRVRKVLKRAKL